MTSRLWITTLALGGLAAGLGASPAAADRLLTLKSHTDAMQMMGQNVPAKDETHHYWFGEQAVRNDMGDVSTILRFDQKKMYWINHAEKTYSAIDLPIDFKKLVPPEMAPMMEQMATMMGGSAKVSATDRSGSFGGFDCKYYRADVTMSMMNMAMDLCVSSTMPVDYKRYQSMVESQAEMLPSTQWMKELAKLQGFPVRTETTTSVMGKSFKSQQELVSSEEKSAPAGTYDPPAGYKEQAFDPMRQGGAGRRR
jgi:hypothetical protein